MGFWKKMIILGISAIFVVSLWSVLTNRKPDHDYKERSESVYIVERAIPAARSKEDLAQRKRDGSTEKKGRFYFHNPLLLVMPEISFNGVALKNKQALLLDISTIACLFRKAVVICPAWAFPFSSFYLKVFS
jgi:hypothetical protein